MASKMQKPFLKTPCSHCRVGQFKEDNKTGDWWLSCNECGSLMFCYNPMPHQAIFHEDYHKFKMFAGGYGSAKTSTCAADMIKLTLETPNGTSLIGAATQPQLEQTAKKDFMSMLHPDLIDNYSVQKNYLDLINGHRILFRPLDDEGKAKSLNLCFIWIEEASEVNFNYIVQLQTRLRNHATDRHQMLLSTNPDLGHVRTEFLLKADKIYGSDRPYYVSEEDKNPNIAVHIAATHLNIYLPPDYYDTTAASKPKWWIERYLNASFDFAEGAVYQDFREHIVQPFPIPDNWERLGGGDFGIRDHTVLLMGAIDPDTGIVYVYDEYYKNGLTVPQHAAGMKELLEDFPVGALRSLVGDPSGKRRNINDLTSLFDHYREYGIFFKEGNNRIEPGIAKVQAYFGLAKLKIFETCQNTIREGMNYKYKPQEMDSSKALDEKPMDKDNHAMDSLRYLVGELPDDPNMLKTKGANPFGRRTTNNDADLPFALQAPKNKTATRSSSAWYDAYY